MKYLRKLCSCFVFGLFCFVLFVCLFKSYWQTRIQLVSIILVVFTFYLCRMLRGMCGPLKFAICFLYTCMHNHKNMKKGCFLEWMQITRIVIRGWKLPVINKRGSLAHSLQIKSCLGVIFDTILFFGGGGKFGLVAKPARFLFWCFLPQKRQILIRVYF